MISVLPPSAVKTPQDRRQRLWHYSTNDPHVPGSDTFQISNPGDHILQTQPLDAEQMIMDGALTQCLQRWQDCSIMLFSSTTWLFPREAASVFLSAELVGDATMKKKMGPLSRCAGTQMIPSCVLCNYP